MTCNRTYDSWGHGILIDGRNERPLSIALVTAIVTWSVAFLITVC